MSVVKKILKGIFVLRCPIAYMVSVPCFVFVGIVLALEYTGPLAYMAYLLSSYALMVFSIAIVRDLSQIADAFRNSKVFRKICELPFIGKLIQDDFFRIRLSLYFGALINVLYVILKITTGVMYRSSWLIFFGLYYLALAILRLFIIEKDRKNIYGNTDSIADYKRLRACGLILLFLNIVLSFITLLAVEFKGEIDYPGVLIFGMAFYSFYALITTFCGIIKYRKHKSVMFSAAKVSSFTAALVSMLSLEIAMTARFGAEAYLFRKRMTAITGAGVFIIVLVLSALMIQRANTLIKKAS